MLDQLRWRPEDARLSDSLLKKATALHTIVPAEHRIGTPQVSDPLPAWLPTHNGTLAHTAQIHWRELQALKWYLGRYRSGFLCAAARHMLPCLKTVGVCCGACAFP